MDRLKKLVQEALGENFPSFLPVAYYHEELDMIVVITRECSYFENPHGRTMSILEDNYPAEGEEKTVGFQLFYAKSFCVQKKIITNSVVPVLRLFEAVADQFPETKSEIEIIARSFADIPTGRSDIWWIE